jgi:hypothetical protein
MLKLDMRFIKRPVLMLESRQHGIASPKGDGEL